ncbi:MAG: hypothetical protein R2844_02485 [Caldilineales bacterium]
MAILEFATSSLPIILAFFGVIAILLAVLGRIEGSVKVDISPRRQGILVVIGILLLATRSVSLLDSHHLTTRTTNTS